MALALLLGAAQFIAFGAVNGIAGALGVAFDVVVLDKVLHALAVGGLAGVAHALTILQTELEVAMALTGRARLADIDRSVIFDRPPA